MKKVVYQTTKKECQSIIDKHNRVCQRCGRRLVPINTVDNFGNPTYWSGCCHGRDWGHFTQGVSKEVYDLAYKLVLDGKAKECSFEMDVNELNNREERQIWFENQVSYMTSDIVDILTLKDGRKPRYTKAELFKKMRNTKKQNNEM